MKNAEKLTPSTEEKVSGGMCTFETLICCKCEKISSPDKLTYYKKLGGLICGDCWVKLPSESRHKALTGTIVLNPFRKASEESKKENFN